jgi:hypothetical protein
MDLSILETLMYHAGQVFLAPVLALITVLFLYAFYALGAFLVQWRQRARSGAFGNRPGYPLVSWAKQNPDAGPDALELYAHKLLEVPRIATRVAPMLGLVGTMIPMGPALKALADGNFQGVSHNLSVAFSAVILALTAAAMTYWIVTVKRRWLAEEIRAVEAGRPASWHAAPDEPRGLVEVCESEARAQAEVAP